MFVKIQLREQQSSAPLSGWIASDIGLQALEWFVSDDAIDVQISKHILYSQMIPNILSKYYSNIIQTDPHLFVHKAQENQEAAAVASGDAQNVVHRDQVALLEKQRNELALLDGSRPSALNSLSFDHTNCYQLLSNLEDLAHLIFEFNMIEVLISVSHHHGAIFFVYDSGSKGRKSSKSYEMSHWEPLEW